MQVVVDKGRLERLSAENERLIDACEEWIATSNRLGAENDRLRELCADLRFCRRNNCLTCKHGRFCDMRFDERYAELGIEVGG